MLDTVRMLYREGGIPRFYQGVWFALAEGPLSRGVGASANYATLHLMSQTRWAMHLPTVVQTAISSLGVATFRLIYYPLDTAKTAMQVEGPGGLKMLRERARRDGLASLYNGASSSIVGAAVRHTLWFSTYNMLAAMADRYNAQAAIDYGGVNVNSQGDEDGSVAFGTYGQVHGGHGFGDNGSGNGNGYAPWNILQNAAIGLACALVTDVVGNPLSVLKAYRQTAERNVSYREVIARVTKEHGLRALFTRGLSTRLTVDAINSVVFTVLWRLWAPTPGGTH